MPQTTGAVHDQILEIIKPKGWAVLPQRWVVERTLCWLNNSRRLPKDYEISTTSEENMIMISHLHTLLRRFLNTGSYNLGNLATSVTNRVNGVDSIKWRIDQALAEAERLN